MLYSLHPPFTTLLPLGESSAFPSFREAKPVSTKFLKTTAEALTAAGYPGHKDPMVSVLCGPLAIYFYAEVTWRFYSCMVPGCFMMTMQFKKMLFCPVPRGDS